MRNRGSRKLFDLIKTLSIKETKAIKAILKNSKKQKSLKLFIFLCKQKTFDDDKVFAYVYKGEREMSAFSQLKKFLYDIILSEVALVDFGESKIGQIEIMIIKSKSLIQRGLYNESLKIIDELIKDSTTLLFYNLALKCWKLKVKVALFFNDIKLIKSFEKELFSFWEKIKLDQNKENEYWFLYCKQQIAVKIHGIYSINKNKENDLFENDRRNSNPIANIYLFLLLGNQSRAMKRKKLFKINVEKALLTFEQNPILKEEHKFLYFNCLGKSVSSYLSCLDFIKATELNYSFFHAVLDSRIETKAKDILLREFYIRQLVIYNSGGYFEEALDLIREINDSIKAFHEGIHFMNIVIIYISVYFVNCDYENSLKWLNILRNSPKTNNREDLKRFSHWLEIFINIELGNIQLLESKIRSFNRYVKQQKEYKKSKVEESVYKLVKNLTQLKVNRISAFKMFSSEIEKALKFPEERIIQDFFHIKSWIDSNINNTTFKQEATIRLKKLTPIA